MSLLHNKRNRDESLNDSNSTFKENTYLLNKFNNCFDIMRNNEILLEENSSNNINKNNTYDIFQKMFPSINSRKNDIFQNNIIMSPLIRSNIFIDSFQKLKIFDRISTSNDKSKIIFPKLNSSLFNNKVSPNNKKKFIFSPFSSFKLEKNFNCEGLLNNNADKFPLKLDFSQNNFSEKKNIFEFNSEKKIKQENINNLGVKSYNFFDNKLNSSNSNKKSIQYSIQKRNSLQIHNNKDFLENNPINTSLFNSVIDKNNDTNKNNKRFEKSKSNINNFSPSKPFQTFNAKTIKKNNKNNDSYSNSKNQKVAKQKIFHIEKIFNKKEYKDAHEKEEKVDEKNFINRFKITLRKIKQIYINSCLKIYSYLNKNSNFNESNLNNELYISNIKKEVCEIIKSKKISSSKMNQILQVNDDDKYRKHYFMFTSEAKEFCLNLIKKNNLPFDVVMKMCKVPRKSLRRWLYVGCFRKKGCGRKTKNPEMEEKLVEWYNEITKKKGIKVCARMIREKAMSISNDKDFLASKGWLEKFKKKYDIKVESNRNKNFKRILSSENSSQTNYKKSEKNDKIYCELNTIKKKDAEIRNQNVKIYNDNNNSKLDLIKPK